MAASKVVLISGSNSGIGFEALKVFLNAAKPYHILAAARTDEKARAAVAEVRKEFPNVKNTIEPLAVDVTSDSSIEQAFAKVKSSPGRLDALINNAGATLDSQFVAGKISLRESFNGTYDVNVTGASVLTWTFMPLLLKSADPRLIFTAGLSSITSVDEGDHSPTPELPAGWPKKIDFETIAYRSSKVALNMLTLDWAFKLKNDGVKVWGVAPGFLATNLGGMKDQVQAMGAGHPKAGGELYLKVIEGERDQDAGKVIKKDGFLPL